MENSGLSKKEYLKKYLSGGDKKKKKKKKTAQTAIPKSKIVDDDIDLKNMKPLNDDELEIFDIAEEAPQIAGIIDDRPDEIKVMDQYRSTKKWKIVADEFGIEDVKVTDLGKKNSNDIGNKSSGKKSDSDESPPRRKFESLEVKIKEEIDSDASPPRKGQRKDDSDASPPRKGRRKSSDSDASPPRKSKRKNGDSDASPPRKGQRKDDSDVSPPRRGRRKDSDSDASPPRKGGRKNDSDSDASPPRRPRHKPNSGSSPTRKNGSSYKNRGRDSDRSRDRHKENARRPHSPEVKREASVQMKKDENYGLKLNKSQKTDSNVEKKTSQLEKTLSGKKAGLQNAEEMKKEIENLKQKEKDMFNKMSDDVTGRHAEAIHRNRKTGRRRDAKEEAKLKREKEEKEAEKIAQYAVWGKGVKQVQDRQEKLQEELYEMSKPLARYKDDKDLEDMLKNQERDGDPMLEYIRRKKKEENGPARPEYQGVYLPNRYNIKPGHKWDGVDRSNGYEAKWFEEQNARKAREEEAYKWSTEDM